MKKVFHDFFSFTSLERKGMVVLIVLLLGITALNFYLANYRPDISPRDTGFLENELRSFEQQLSLEKENESPRTDIPYENLNGPAELFNFDPNEATAVELRRLGLSNSLIRTILSYRKHGGRFRQKEDLKKIYGLDSHVYEQLSPWIKIADASDYPLPKAPSSPGSGNRMLNMNEADSVDFERLPGIGPVLARRIVRYRALLGGYYATVQLKEVYGITDSLFSLISRHVYTDTTMILKISVNQASEKDLAHHPYIGKYTAGGIIRFRNRVHPIQNLDELYINGIITSEKFEKLKKYLTI